MNYISELGTRVVVRVSCPGSVCPWPGQRRSIALWSWTSTTRAKTKWKPSFKDRVSRNGGRLKKTTIVALARKLLVALWKYVTAGVVIEGAIVKSN